MVAAAFDRVEVGGIEVRERMQRQKARHHVGGLAGRAERRLDRAIIGAVALAGAHDEAAFEIDNGNDFHALGSLARL